MRILPSHRIPSVPTVAPSTVRGGRRDVFKLLVYYMKKRGNRSCVMYRLETTNPHAQACLSFAGHASITASLIAAAADSLSPFAYSTPMYSRSFANLKKFRIV